MYGDGFNIKGYNASLTLGISSKQIAVMFIQYTIA